METYRGSLQKRNDVAVSALNATLIGKRTDVCRHALTPALVVKAEGCALLSYAVARSSATSLLLSQEPFKTGGSI